MRMDFQLLVVNSFDFPLMRQHRLPMQFEQDLTRFICYAKLINYSEEFYDEK